MIGGGGKGAAGLRLGHYIDDFPVGDSLMLHNQGAVQMLAALSGDVNAHGSKYAAQSLKDSVCHLGCGPAAHIVSHYFAGGASNYHNLTLVQLGGFRQLTGGIGGFLSNLRQKVFIFYIMNGSCHKNTSFQRIAERLAYTLLANAPVQPNTAICRQGKGSCRQMVLYHIQIFSAIRAF